MATEEQYLDQLNQIRAQEAQERNARPPEIKKRRVTFPLFAFLAGAVNDLSDWGVIGSIPVVGDFLDVISGLIRWINLKMRRGRANGGLNTGLAVAVEFIPVVGDIPPSFMIEAIVTYLQEKAIAEREYQAALSTAPEE